MQISHIFPNENSPFSQNAAVIGGIAAVLFHQPGESRHRDFSFLTFSGAWSTARFAICSSGSTAGVIIPPSPLVISPVISLRQPRVFWEEDEKEKKKKQPMSREKKKGQRWLNPVTGAAEKKNWQVIIIWARMQSSALWLTAGERGRAEGGVWCLWTPSCDGKSIFKTKLRCSLVKPLVHICGVHFLFFSKVRRRGKKMKNKPRRCLPTVFAHWW